MSHYLARPARPPEEPLHYHVVQECQVVLHVCVGMHNERDNEETRGGGSESGCKWTLMLSVMGSSCGSCLESRCFSIILRPAPSNVPKVVQVRQIKFYVFQVFGVLHTSHRTTRCRCKDSWPTGHGVSGAARILVLAE